MEYKKGDKVLWRTGCRNKRVKTSINKITAVNKTSVKLSFPQRYGKAATGTLEKEYIIKVVK